MSALTPTVIAALRAHRARQLSERMIAGELWTGGDLVFCDAVGWRLNAQSLTRSAYRRLLERAGLPRRRFHDLRHSAATLMLKAGVPLKVVSEMQGHTTIRVTADVYGHVTPDMQRDAVGALEALLHRA